MNTDGLETSLGALERALARWLGSASVGARVAEEVSQEDGGKGAQEKAVWTTAYINNLPDSSFLYIEPGGKKDEGGRTVPRSLRHFPVRDLDGSVDMPHLRNALSRIPQSDVPQDAKDKAAAAAQRLLEEAKKSDDLSWPDDLATKEFRAGVEKKVDELRGWGQDPWAKR